MKPSTFALAALAAIFSLPAQARMDGPAAPVAKAYMSSGKAPCYRRDRESQCPIASLDQGARMYYPDDSTALVFVPYQYDATGNGTDQMVIVLRAEGGRWKVLGRADTTQGTDPTSFRFVPSGITYVGRVMSGGDSRSGPTGKATFRLDVDDTGVRFAGRQSR